MPSCPCAPLFRSLLHTPFKSKSHLYVSILRPCDGPAMAFLHESDDVPYQWPLRDHQDVRSSRSSSPTLFVSPCGPLRISTSTNRESSQYSDECSPTTQPEELFEVVSLTQHRDDFSDSESCPDADAMAEAADVPIFDSHGNARPFKSLYSGELAMGEQQLVIFIRHFFCGVCKFSPAARHFPCMLIFF
jgi:hypothetical protein